MEELEEDGVYFILKSGLSSRISLDRAQNVHHGESNDQRSDLLKMLSTTLIVCNHVKLCQIPQLIIEHAL